MMRLVLVPAAAAAIGAWLALMASAASHAHRGLAPIRFRDAPVHACDECDEPMFDVGWRDGR